MASKESNDPYEQLQPGDHVKHPKFGEGQIQYRTGYGDDTKFVVQFAEEGEKRLMAKYAKLKKTRAIQSEDDTTDEEE